MTSGDQVPALLVNAGRLLPVLQDKVGYGLNVSPSDICVLKPNPPCDGIWSWGLWVISGYKGGALLARGMRELGSLSALYHVRKDVARKWPSITRKRVCTRTQPCWHPDLILPAFRNVRKGCLLFKPPNLWVGEGNGNPLQYSCLENPVDRGAWRAAVHRIAQSQTWLKQLSMRACIGEGNGNPLQYSCLENPRDGGAWWAAIYGVTQSWTRLKWFSSSSSSSLWVSCYNNSNWLR